MTRHVHIAPANKKISSSLVTAGDSIIGSPRCLVRQQCQLRFTFNFSLAQPPSRIFGRTTSALARSATGCVYPIVQDRLNTWGRDGL